MPAEAIFKRNAAEYSVIAAATIAAGEVYQLPTGEAGVRTGLMSAATGDTSGFVTRGQHTVLKTASVAILQGLPVYWDHSANKAHFKKVNDRDFYLGVCTADAAAADTTVTVNLNVQPVWDIDLLAPTSKSVGGFLSVATGTQAVGAFGYPKPYGGSYSLELTATNEAQCIDMLSVDKFTPGAKAIARFVIRPAANGSTSAVDLSIGVASATSTTDADAIAESAFFHIDGGSTTINAECDDGTNETNATDTTKTISAGSAVANRSELWIDLRDMSSIKFYVDGVRVNSGTTFNATLAAGPLGLLVHLEKSSSTATAGPIYVDAAALTLRQQST